MFRIDKQLVLQLAQPADIPLIPVSIPMPMPMAESESEQEASETLKETVAAANMEAAGAKARKQALIQEAQQKASQILRDAEQQAALMLQEAKQQAEQQAEAIRAEAWQSGCEEGKQEGRQEALLQVKAEQEEHNRAAKEQLQAILTQISAVRDKFFANMETETIDLALAVSHKVTHNVLMQNSDSLRSLMKQLLRQMSHDSKITIHVSEEQYDTFFRTGSEHFVLGDKTLNVSIVGDPELNTGDLLLESGEETINAGVDSQYKYITLAFGRPWEPGL